MDTSADLQSERARYEGMVSKLADQGLLPATELEAQLRLVQNAGSLGDLQAIMRDMPLLGTSAGAGAPARTAVPTQPAAAATQFVHTAAARPASPVSQASRSGADLDAVDLALLQRKASGAYGSKGAPRRFNKATAMVIVVVMLVALIVIGIVLASTSHPRPAGTTGMSQIPTLIRLFTPV